MKNGCSITIQSGVLLKIKCENPMNCDYKNEIKNGKCSHCGYYSCHNQDAQKNALDESINAINEFLLRIKFSREVTR